LVSGTGAGRPDRIVLAAAGSPVTRGLATIDSLVGGSVVISYGRPSQRVFLTGNRGDRILRY
jgi:hypothetical protein